MFAWDTDPIADSESYLYRQSENRGADLVEQDRGTFILLPNGRRAVQLFPPLEVLQEQSARNCVTPFGRLINKLMAPPNLHYEIPAEGDHRLSWLYRFMHANKKKLEPELEPASA